MNLNLPAVAAVKGLFVAVAVMACTFLVSTQPAEAAPLATGNPAFYRQIRPFPDVALTPVPAPPVPIPYPNISKF